MIYRMQIKKERKKGSYRVLVIKPEGKRPVGRPLHRCKGNIKVNVKAIRWEDMD
jgi:hypothetical protein